MPIGLDWGTATVIACRNISNPDDNNKKAPRYRQQRNCYIEIEANDFTKNIISQSDMSFVELTDDSMIYVVGNDAIQLSSTLSSSNNRVEIKRPMKAGVMSGDAKSAQIMSAIAESVLGDPKEDGEIVVYSVPSDPIDADFKTFYHRGMTEMALKQSGWTPHAINEALAIVYSESPEMIDDNTGDKVPFTGVGISFGGGMINVCVAYRGLETISFSLANAFGMEEGCAGDWIDLQMFRAKKSQFGSIGRATLYKEENANFKKDPMEYAQEVAKKSTIHRGDAGFHFEALMTIQIYYERLMDYVITNLAREFESKNPTIDGSLDFVLAGGTAIPDGFEGLFEKRLEEKSLPFRVGEIKKASNPIRAISRGCMGAAEIGYKA